MTVKFGVLMKSSYFSILFLVLSASGGYCQVPSVLITRQGSVAIEEFGPYSFSRSSGSCTADGCSVQRSLANYYDSEVQSSKTGVVGRARRIYSDVNVNGLSSGGYVSDIYAKVPFGQQVVIKLPISSQVTWNNKVNNIDGSTQGTATLYNNSYSVYDGTACYVGADIAGSCSASKVARIYGAAEGSPLVIGGDSYYPVGNIDMYGRASLMKYSGPNPDVNFSVSLGQAQVFYRGNVLELHDPASDNQTGLVNTELPNELSVQVVDGETGDQRPGVPVTFSIVNPANGVKFFGDTTSTQVSTVDGIASVRLILGNAPGTYTVKATCPDAVCTSGAKEVTFTATALSRQQATELRSDAKLCELYGVAGRQMTPFRVVAVNALTGAVETGVTIRYERVSFTDIQGNTSLTFPEDSTFRYKKLTGGYESATLTPGSQEGTYAVKAVCDECLGNASVVCHGYVRNTQVPAGLPSASSANPFDRDPITGKPLTPVVRIQEMVTQNNGNSFTTDVSENLVTFKALVLPEDFAEQSEITWNVIDDPRDNFSSPVPAQNPVPKSGSKYEAVYRVWLDNVDGGRPAPLKYLVTAKAVVEDKEALSPYRELKQDEIDKCRQEYVDYSIGLADVPRSTFTAGLHSEYSKQVRDCFAYIYPTAEAGKVDSLRAAGHTVNVTSGYRSPRHNILYVGSTKLSAHIYGEAIDITPVPAVNNAMGWETLWGAAACAKVLETGNAATMLWCATGESNEDLKQGSAFPKKAPSTIYNIANCLHLGNLKH